MNMIVWFRSSARIVSTFEKCDGRAWYVPISNADPFIKEFPWRNSRSAHLMLKQFAGHF
jgi:hypothetical protein